MAMSLTPKRSAAASMSSPSAAAWWMGCSGISSDAAKLLASRSRALPVPDMSDARHRMGSGAAERPSSHWHTQWPISWASVNRRRPSLSRDSRAFRYT